MEMGFEKGKSVMKPQADNAFSEWTLRLYPVSLFFDDKFRNTGIKINYLKCTAVLLTSSLPVPSGCYLMIPIHTARSL